MRAALGRVLAVASLLLALSTGVVGPADAQQRFNTQGLAKTMTVIVLPAYASGGTVTRTAANGTVTTSSVAASTAVQLLAANDQRRNFRIMNIGTNRATYGYGTAVAPGAGWPVAPAASAGDQGGADEDPAPHTGAIYGVSAAGTTIVVIEG